MNKSIQATLLGLAMLATGLDVKAETFYLVIPAQYWSSAVPYETQIVELNDYGRYSGQFRCETAAIVLHQLHPAPAYSLCTVNQPDTWTWR